MFKCWHLRPQLAAFVALSLNPLAYSLLSRIRLELAQIPIKCAPKLVIHRNDDASTKRKRRWCSLTNLWTKQILCYFFVVSRGNAQHKIKCMQRAVERNTGSGMAPYTLQISWEYIKLCCAFTSLKIQHFFALHQSFRLGSGSVGRCRGHVGCVVLATSIGAYKPDWQTAPTTGQISKAK